MDREKFEELVDKAVKNLPAEFLDHLGFEIANWHQNQHYCQRYNFHLV